MIGHSQISPISQPVLKQGISWFAIKYWYALKKCAISNEVLTRLCSSLLDRNFGIELDPIARNYLNYSMLRYELKVIFLNVVLEARIPSIKEQLNKCTYYIRCTIRTLLQHASNFKLPPRYQYVMGKKFIGISAVYVQLIPLKRGWWGLKT